MTAVKCVVLALLVASLTGCVSGKGWEGLVPGKDIEAEELTNIIVTPWGHAELRIKGLTSRVNPKGERPDPPPDNAPPVLEVPPGVILRSK